jgi:hypothetical protein
VPSERLWLNTFPRPAKAKLIKVSMISFFIVPTSYQDTHDGKVRLAFFPLPCWIRGHFSPVEA